MTMFPEGMRAEQQDDPRLAPGPAAYSDNGNGAINPDDDVLAVTPSGIPTDPMVWIAEAPYWAIIACSATGALVALFLMWVGKQVK